MNTISDRIKEALKLKNMKQSDLVTKTGIGKSSISTYISGAYEPKQRNIYKIAKALNVSEAWLMGYDVPMERNTTAYIDNNSEKYGLMPITTHKIPLLGEIACGVPVFAQEERENYIEAGTNIRADFCLKAKGDSMINARILDGDIVFVRKQNIVENGEIAAVIINDEATLKRVFYYPEKNTLILKAENPKYEDFIYINEELNSIRILGKAIAFQSNVI